jgi:hypothetical protein
LGDGAAHCEESIANVAAGELVTVSVFEVAVTVIEVAHVAADTTAAKVKSPASMAATSLNVYVAMQTADFPTGSGFAAG